MLLKSTGHNVLYKVFCIVKAEKECKKGKWRICLPIGEILQVEIHSVTFMPLEEYKSFTKTSCCATRPSLYEKKQ